jgi:hypothetical protein
MSLEMQSVHVHLEHEPHEMVSIMAEHRGIPISTLMRELVTKAIVGEFHVFKIAAERTARLGSSGKLRDLRPGS